MRKFIFLICVILIFSLSFVCCENQPQSHIVRADTADESDLEEISELFPIAVGELNLMISHYGNGEPIELSDIHPEKIYRVYRNINDILEKNLHGNDVLELLENSEYFYELQVTNGEHVYTVPFVKTTLYGEPQWALSGFGETSLGYAAEDAVNLYNSSIHESVSDKVLNNTVYFIQLAEFQGVCAMIVTENQNYFKLFANSPYHSNDLAGSFVDEKTFIDTWNGIRDIYGSDPDETIY